MMSVDVNRMIGRNPGIAASIGSISASQIVANGSGRQRPRGTTFCDGGCSSQIPACP
jgi:hypothetical protein